jgi:AGZA family xanthine/uracil permease-like MFS transporter
MLDRLFKIKESGSTIRTEIIAGVTTFMTMAYIIFVNPAILAQGAKMDFNAVMVATCLSAAVTTLLMTLLANYPIGLAIGFVSYPLIKLFCVKGREVHWMVYLLSVIFITGYLLV